MSRIQFLQRNVASAQQAAQSNYLMGDIQERFAMVHAKISAFTASKASLTKTLKSCKGAMPLQYGHVIASYRRNKFNEALTGLQNLIVQQPNNPYFHELKGEILFSRGDLDGAIQSYRTAHELELQSLLLTLMYASSLIKAKQNMPEAQELLHQIVLVERDNAQAWQEMAKLYQHHKNQPMVHLCLAFSSYLMSDPVTAQKHIKALKSMESTLDKQQKQWLEDLQSFESNIAQPL
jgi:predicted Zn-dependent protease